MSFEGQEGCLFIINGRKYIYTGIKKNKKNNMVPTFYGLDGLNNGEINNLNGINIDQFENKSLNDSDAAVLEIVRSPVYSEYKPGIPKNLRPLPGFSSAAAFYELPGINGTPKRIEKITERERMLDPNNPNYVYRVGSNGPSIRYIKEGKITEIDKFIKDYEKMILKKSKQPLIQSPYEPSPYEPSPYEPPPYEYAMQQTSPMDPRYEGIEQRYEEMDPREGMDPRERINPSVISPKPLFRTTEEDQPLLRRKPSFTTTEEEEDPPLLSRKPLKRIQPLILSDRLPENQVVASRFTRSPSFENIKEFEEPPRQSLGGRSKRLIKKKKSKTYKK